MHPKFGTVPAVLCLLSLSACASLVSSAASGLAGSLNTAMLNQEDPQIVRDGAPAYMLLLDGMVADAPRDVGLLRAASELYAAYGVVFVEDAERARTLTSRARSYGQRALCASEESTCGSWDRPFEEFEGAVARTRDSDVPALYSFAVSWLAYIQAHREDWSALAQLPQVRVALETVQELNPDYRVAKIQHYLGVLNTIRPPALGGDFDAGQEHFERAIEMSGGLDFSVKVDYAKYFARTLYDRELHDRLLNEVLEADPHHEGLVLMNILAQGNARALLESGDEYF